MQFDPGSYDVIGLNLDNWRLCWKKGEWVLRRQVINVDYSISPDCFLILTAGNPEGSVIDFLGHESDS